MLKITFSVLIILVGVLISGIEFGQQHVSSQDVEENKTLVSFHSSTSSMLIDRFDTNSSDNYNGTNFHKGLITSHLYPNTTIENVKILPHRHDGYGYSGVLTFTSSKPVEVVLAHSIPMNSSEIKMVEDQFGKLYKFFENVDYLPNVLSIPTVIQPDYGIHSPYFSATIPFAADSVILRNTNGEPFVAIYEVSFHIEKPRLVLDKQSMD